MAKIDARSGVHYPNLAKDPVISRGKLQGIVQVDAVDVSCELTSLPVFDLCQKDTCTTKLGESMAECMTRTGCLLVRDPSVNEADNIRFNEMMQRYFEQPTAVKMLDARPDVHYQVGVTPDGVEVPRCTADPSCMEAVQQQAPEHRATLPSGPDPKWRFFWRLGTDPEVDSFESFRAAPVIPQGFPEWSEVMTGWGAKMLGALQKSAELLAIGFHLPKTAFSSLMINGPHLMGPTGVNLGEHSESKNPLAGYHYDLNLMTIHGKSQFPGLFIWLADGRRIPVRIPDGCLLIQAGKQLEWLTAGQVKAGMHEVICSEATRQAVAKAKQEGKSLWRTSSTVFGHVASDNWLRPLCHFANLPGARQYPPTKAGDYVQSELKQIALKRSPMK